ncbi:MAG: NHL repeat-containing protein [Acidobacteria bacterium]|nr:NHL repeat-containing protein [Acidobacteriota bacterium]
MTKNKRYVSILTLILTLSFISISNSTSISSAQSEEPIYLTDLHLLNKDIAEKSNFDVNAVNNDASPEQLELDALASTCLTINGALGQGTRQSIPFSTGAQNSRVFRDGVATNCNGKAFPGTLSGNFKYDAYRFQNTTDEDRCITVNLNKVSCNNTSLFAAAYLNCFNPNNIAQNYIADAGTSAVNRGFSFNIPAGAQFVVVISSVSSSDVSCGNYSFAINGMSDCGRPDFNLACGKGAPLEHKNVFFTDTANNRIQMSSDEGQTWTTVGKGQGEATGHFNGPRGVATSANGSIIFVADTLNNRVQRSTDGGKTWRVLAGQGTTINILNFPQAVAYDETQNILYVADTGNSRIVKVTNASAIATFTVFADSRPGRALGQFDRPRGIAVDSIGRVYVADTGNNRVQISTTGMAGGWAVYAGATAGSDLGRLNSPVGIFVDSLNRVYVADTGNNRIQINKDGTLKGWSLFMGPGSNLGNVNGPEGITLAASGSVFIGDTLNNRIQRKTVIGGNERVVSAPGQAVGEANQPTSIR